jgi:hypothetical protein
VRHFSEEQSLLRKTNRKQSWHRHSKLFKEIQGQLANKFGIEQERNAFIANLKFASNQSETNRPKVVF